MWRETPEWTETLELRGAAAADSSAPYRGSLLAADGQFLCLGELGHLLWMDLTPKGYKEVSRAWLFPARESWALPVLSRGLLYVVQNTRDMLARERPAAAVLRPARIEEIVLFDVPGDRVLTSVEMAGQG